MQRFSVICTAIVGGVLAALPVAAQPANPAAPKDSHSVEEVQVTASKLDSRTLKRVAIQFAKAHGAANPVSNQIGRWQRDVCPRVTGLQPAASAFVARRVTEDARSVGAPTPKNGKGCAGGGEFASVEIVFTPEPQRLLNHIAKAYPVLLGSARLRGDTTFKHAIQSWYLTGTKAMNGWSPPAEASVAAMQIQAQIDASTPPGVDLGEGLRVDPAYGEGYAASGLSGSHFSKGLTSEILQVLVVVDTSKVTGDSLASISDYIAMLALTRIGSLDGCNELSSIIDLLSSGCPGREKPQALTAADIAYLKALYSAGLEKNLNFEQGEMRDRMVSSLTGR